MFRMEHAPDRNLGILVTMAKQLQGPRLGLPQILTAERDGNDGLIVAFSDETIGAYVVEELLELRPIREKLRKPKRKNPGREPAVLR